MGTAQGGQDGTEPQGYREWLFKLLGDRDPLEVMARTAAALEGIVRGHPTTLLHTRPAEGKWSPTEVIGHLVDGEWVYGYRVRFILCEDSPVIMGMDQNLWVTGMRHNDQDPAGLLEQFRSLREFNLSVWKRMSPADLQRAGRHSERGTESLGVLLKLFGGHDLAHLDQIARTIQAIQETGKGLEKN